EAPSPRALRSQTFQGPLQWALEGGGWNVVRPSVDFVMLWAAVIAALGGVSGLLHVSGVRAPLLALPPLVMLLFYLRGLYQTRLRAVVLDGIVPVLSAISVAAMAVALLGTFLNNQVPSESVWLRGWVFALIGVGLGRIARLPATLGSRQASRGQARSDHGGGRGGRPGGTEAREPPGVRSRADRLPRRGSALGGRGG